MPDVKEEWSPQSLVWSSANQSWTAVREFTVAFYAGERASNLRAEQLVTGIGAGEGAQHNENSALTCWKLSSTRPGFKLFRVRSDYKQLTSTATSPDPLKAPVKFKWDVGLISAPVDIDRDGNPIKNAAGDAYDKPPPVDVGTYHLTLLRNEPWYDVRKAITYLNAVNTDSWAIPKAGVILPGQGCCRGIKPTGSYDLTAKYVPVEYTFEFRPELDQQGQPRGWKLRLQENGSRSWYKDPFDLKTKQGNIVHNTGKNVQAPVPLDEEGKPLDTDSYRVGPDLTIFANQPVKNPAPPKGPKYEKFPQAIFALWNVRKSAAFGSLNLF